MSFWEAKVRESSIVLSECSDGTVHRHSHSYFEFAYVVRGRAEHTINDRTFLLSEGDYFLIDLDSTHEYREISGSEGFCIINCLFFPEFIDGTLTRAGSLQEIMNGYFQRFAGRKVDHRVALRPYHDQDGFLGVLVRRMLAEYREKRPGYEEILRNSLVSLLVCLVRNDPRLGDGEEECITKYVTEYVAKHYMDKISLSQISRVLNFSLTHVSLTFKREVGISFRDYLIKIRMEKACRLLRNTDKTISEISELVGYSDPAFFYKAFARVLGQSPASYRRQATGQ